jgi:general secretion pathway protein N
MELQLRMPAGRSIALLLALVVASGGVPATDLGAANEKASAAIKPARNPEAPASPLAPSGNPLWAIPLGELQATRERPIFSPSRRPPAPRVFALAAAEPPKLAPPPPEPTRPPLVLMGTIVGESRQIGIFFEETTKEMVRLTTGEGHRGWLLRSVDRLGVHFVRGERVATLMLRPPDQQKVPGAEAAAMAELIPPVRHRQR